jgi:hypothetical protein
MKAIFVLAVAVGFVVLGLGPLTSDAYGGEPVCVKTCAVRVADARNDRCRVTLAKCRARCPAEGQPGWDRCVTRCGEALEHCLGE